MNADVTDAPAAWGDVRVDRRRIERLWARGLLDAAARDHALGLVDPPRNWGLWAARILTVFGVALILSGLVYFFAFNWERIPPTAKLAGIGALLIAAAATPVVLGLDHAVGQIATTVATVLVGLFLAVFGQIYQTGADAWGLFFLWAALTLPWAVLSSSAATWAVWTTVADVAIWLWWKQVHPFDGAYHFGSSLSILTLHGVALVAREGLAVRGVAWLAGRWTRFFLLVPLLGATTTAALGWIVRTHDVGALDRVSGAAAVATIGACLVVWRRVVVDVPALALTLTASCVLVVMLAFQLLDRAAPRADFGVFLILGVFTLTVFAAAVAWLRRVAREVEAHHE
ncbi:MAG: DUF2157 domain-containing protein [Siculibacillus sp.]